MARPRAMEMESGPAGTRGFVPLRADSRAPMAAGHCEDTAAIVSTAAVAPDVIATVFDAAARGNRHEVLRHEVLRHVRAHGFAALRDADGNTVLHTAAIHDHVPLVERLLRHPGVSARVRNTKQQLALHVACDEEALGAMRALVAATEATDATDATGGTAAMNAKDLHGQTPLLMASATSVACVAAFLDAWQQLPAPPVLDCAGSMTSLVVAARATPLHAVCRAPDSLEAVTAAPPPAAAAGRQLEEISAEGRARLRVVQRLLSLPSTCIDICDAAGRSALHVACRAGHLLVVRALLRHGALVNMRAGDRGTPLHVACRSNRPMIVRELAQLRRCHAPWMSERSMRPTALEQAVTRHHAECVEQLMAMTVCNYPYATDTKVPLVAACEHNDGSAESLAVIDCLLRYGYDRCRVLRCAVTPNSMEAMAVKKLCAQDALPAFRRVCASFRGQTPSAKVPIYADAITCGAVDIVRDLFVSSIHASAVAGAFIAQRRPARGHSQRRGCLVPDMHCSMLAFACLQGQAAIIRMLFRDGLAAAAAAVDPETGSSAWHLSAAAACCIAREPRLLRGILARPPLFNARRTAVFCPGGTAVGFVPWVVPGCRRCIGLLLAHPLLRRVLWQSVQSMRRSGVPVQHVVRKTFATKAWLRHEQQWANRSSWLVLRRPT